MHKNPVTIAINGSMLDEEPTGVGVYCFNIINSLSLLYPNEKRRQFTVFTPTSSLLNKNVNIVKLSNLLQSSKYGKIAAVCRFLWNTLYYPVQARRYDLLISPTTHGSFMQNNQVLTIHDLLALRYDNLNIQQTFYFKYLLPSMVSRSKLVIAVSESTKQDIVRFLKCPSEKVKVIHNGYDNVQYNFLEQSENLIRLKYSVSNYLLAVGPTLPHKNFEILLNAYKELDESERKKHPLVLAGGKKKYLLHLKQLTQELNLENDVHFLGYVPMELMAPLYREAMGLVFPSLYEGFGFPILEAMACGCPVISSGTSSMPEVGGDAVLYFDPRDKQALVDSLKKLIGDGELRNVLRQKGLQQAKKFSWEKTARELKLTIDTLF